MTLVSWRGRLVSPSQNMMAWAGGSQVANLWGRARRRHGWWRSSWKLGCQAAAGQARRRPSQLEPWPAWADGGLMGVAGEEVKRLCQLPNGACRALGIGPGLSGSSRSNSWGAARCAARLRCGRAGAGCFLQSLVKWPRRRAEFGEASNVTSWARKEVTCRAQSGAPGKSRLAAAVRGDDDAISVGHTPAAGEGVRPSWRLL